MVTFIELCKYLDLYPCFKDTEPTEELARALLEKFRIELRDSNLVYDGKIDPPNIPLGKDWPVVEDDLTPDDVIGPEEDDDDTQWQTLYAEQEKRLKAVEIMHVAQKSRADALMEVIALHYCAKKM
jgi:hypothetical protein